MILLKIPPGGRVIEKGLQTSTELVRCYRDGAIKNFNGISGFCILSQQGYLIHSHWSKLNFFVQDSNVPELEGLLKSMDFCKEQGFKEVVFYCDSFQALEFLEKQEKGIEKYSQTKDIEMLLPYFDYYRIQNISRNKNKADALCRTGLKALNIK